MGSNMERRTERGEEMGYPGIWVKEGHVYNGCKTFFQGYDEGYYALEKLAEYEDAEEQGLLLRLPVRCGSWVYSAECGCVVPYIVTSYSVDMNGLWCLNRYGGIIGLWGTSVFATKAEAKAALVRNGER